MHLYISQFITSEISRAYERMPNPALLATQEFMEAKIYYRKNEDQDLFK